MSSRPSGTSSAGSPGRWIIRVTRCSGKLSVVDAHPGPLSQQAVADRIGLTKGTVSRQIDHAVSAGLMTVRVAEHTRRENAVALTEAGTALVRKGDALTQTSRAALQDEIDPAELTAAIRVLGGMLRALEP
jgi:DNA-binding MarR family transcriptional regulator